MVVLALEGIFSSGSSTMFSLQYLESLLEYSTMTSMEIWVLYNGFISYFLMGILFVVEFILRKRQQRKHQL